MKIEDLLIGLAVRGIETAIEGFALLGKKAEEQKEFQERVKAEVLATLSGVKSAAEKTREAADAIRARQAGEKPPG